MLCLAFTNDRKLTSRFLPTSCPPRSSFLVAPLFPYIHPSQSPTFTSTSPPSIHFSCASLKQIQSPLVKPPTTCLNPPPALWSRPIRIQAERLIMQAAVSTLRWGPPGDSSTASDWGCATEPDSSTNNTEKRMLIVQIRWELRWEEGVQRRRGGRWQALLISCHSDEASCVW